MNRSNDEEKARVYLQRAVGQYTERDFNGSIETAQLALRHQTNLPAAYNHLGLVYMETKRYEKSEESFKKALELQPVYPEVFNNYGVLLNRLERYDEALAFFEKAYQNEKYITPENALTNAGYSYYRMGKINEARKFHQRALDVNPLFCLASKNMGDVHAKEKNYKKATENFQSALTQCPLYQEAHYKLGLVHMKMGQKKTAKVELEKLVDRHKSGPYVDRSNEVLKFLR